MITHWNLLVRKIAFLLFFFLLLTIQLFAQLGRIKPGSHIASESDISAIRQIYQNINSLNLTKQRFTYESSGCAEDGVVTYFFDNKTIVKVTESGSIGDGSWVNEYYYKAGKIIFCFENIVGGPAIGKVTKTQYRYYIKDNHPIRVMEGTKIVPADSKATEMVETANKIYKAYTTKDFVSALCN